jgi:hypothetical protein
MGVLTLKYGVSVSFYPQTGDVSKILGKHVGILSENLNFFKTHKNSYTRLLCITNPEYGGHDQEIRNFSQFSLPN